MSDRADDVGDSDAASLDPAVAALGIEWVVDARACVAAKLRERAVVERLGNTIIRALALHPVGEPLVHVFPGPGGITMLVLLAESHLALHTFPEVRAMTLNLYCCRPRAPLDWQLVLREAVGARDVSVRSLVRGAPSGEPGS